MQECRRRDGRISIYLVGARRLRSTTARRDPELGTDASRAVEAKPRWSAERRGRGEPSSCSRSTEGHAPMQSSCSPSRSAPHPVVDSLWEKGHGGGSVWRGRSGGCNGSCAGITAYSPPLPTAEGVAAPPPPPGSSMIFGGVAFVIVGGAA